MRHLASGDAELRGMVVNKEELRQIIEGLLTAAGDESQKIFPRASFAMLAKKCAYVRDHPQHTGDVTEEVIEQPESQPEHAMAVALPNCGCTMCHRLRQQAEAHAPRTVWAVKRTDVPDGAELPLVKLFSSQDAAQEFVLDFKTPELILIQYEVNE